MPKKQPIRIVADSRGRTPKHSRLVQSVSSGPVVVATAGQPQDILAAGGVDIWRCGNGTRVDVTSARAPGRRGGDRLYPSGRRRYARGGIHPRLGWLTRSPGSGRPSSLAATACLHLVDWGSRLSPLRHAGALSRRNGLETTSSTLMFEFSISPPEGLIPPCLQVSSLTLERSARPKHATGLCASKSKAAIRWTPSRWAPRSCIPVSA